MELILIAVVALVILAGVDADLWPRPVPKARRSRHVVRYPRRAPARAATRRDGGTPRSAMVGYTNSSSRLCPAPRWWWE